MVDNFQNFGQHLKPIISKRHSSTSFCFFLVFLQKFFKFNRYDYDVNTFFHLQNIPDNSSESDFLFKVLKIFFSTTKCALEELNIIPEVDVVKFIPRNFDEKLFFEVKNNCLLLGSQNIRDHLETTNMRFQSPWPPQKAPKHACNGVMWENKQSNQKCEAQKFRWFFFEVKNDFMFLGSQHIRDHLENTNMRFQSIWRYQEARNWEFELG